MRKKINFLPAFILSIVILLGIFSVSSYGTETRVGSMGGVGLFIRDNTNVFLFPGTINSYPNLIIAELRTKNDDDQYTIGAHLPFGTGAVVGVYLNQPLYLPSDIIAGVAPHLKLNRASALFYGGQLQNYDFGVMLSMALDSWSDKDAADDEEKESARFIGIAGGISNEKLDLGVGIGLPSVSWELEQAECKWGGFGLGINGRYFMEKSNNLQLVPVATFYYGSASYEYDSGVSGVDKAETDYGQLDIGIGIGLNYQLNEKNLVVLGIQAFGLYKETEKVKDGTETTEKWTTLPGIYMGVESEIKPWLIGRMGAVQIYESYTKETKPQQGDTTEDSEYDSWFMLTFGLGINLGSFTLDALFNEGLLFDGPNIISGRINSIAHRISMIYKF